MDDSGSSPLEAAALLLVLVAPLAPAMGLYQHLSDSLAAESIARHGLRSAVLSQEKGAIPSNLGQTIEPLATSWGKTISDFSLNCLNSCRTGDLISLRVQVGSAWAIQTAGLEP